MNDQTHSALVTACRSFMKPIARFLLNHGFTYKEFAEIAKWAFVTVATDDYGIGGRKTNVSRVAVMTGLTRKEVSRVRDTPVDDPPRSAQYQHRPSLLLAAWSSKKDYTQENGEPKVIPISGDGESFESLARAYAGDIPASVVLKELERAQCVERVGEGAVRVLRRTFMPSQNAASEIRHFGASLANLATTIEYNMSPKRNGARLLERTAWSRNLAPVCRKKAQHVALDYGSAFLRQFDNWMSSNESEDLSNEFRALTGVGVYFFDVAD